MKIGLGHLRMRPDDFWKMTLPEFFAACDGYMEAKGVKNGGMDVQAPTREEVEALFTMQKQQQTVELNG